MTLEDHLGDIVRKARQAARVETTAAAAAAGISAQQWSALEESGVAPKPFNFSAAGKLLFLDPKKLEAIANGWLPKETDFGLWRELRLITTTEEYSVNCFLVWDERTREAALFDTGWNAQPAIDLIEENNLQLEHLFITHTHDDHIAGLGQVREKFPKVALHSGSKHAPLAQRNKSHDCIELGSLRITNRETPGHAEDGVTYIISHFPDGAPDAAIVGDCVFAGSIGKGFQSTDLLKQKIHDQIFSLAGSTLICPGHGPCTTVEQECAHNPWL